ncbi:MerR family transcriptional regulator [Streptomyces sp. NBC_01317]|uniref:MerR family transcriptional regulator n=1 Tax=Streptomyces sp. NBC_01317 TaxID=2903822 RepID=UPI002E143E03
MLRIGELAARSDVSVRSLRYYEEQGLLCSVRDPGGRRRFAPEAVARVGLIQRLYGAGLCSSKIGELLPALEEASPGGAPQLRSALSVELRRLDGMIRDLESARAELRSVMDTFAPASPATRAS